MSTVSAYQNKSLLLFHDDVEEEDDTWSLSTKNADSYISKELDDEVDNDDIPLISSKSDNITLLGQENEEEDSYEQESRFQRLYYKSIHRCSYQKLVLPPTCQFMDMSMSKTQKRQTKSILTWFETIRKVISVDYIDMILHFVCRVFFAFGHRWLGWTYLSVDEEEEEDNDEKERKCVGNPNIAYERRNNKLLIATKQPHEDERNEVIPIRSSLTEQTGLDKTLELLDRPDDEQEQQFKDETRDRFYTGDHQDSNSVMPSSMRHCRVDDQIGMSSGTILTNSTTTDVTMDSPSKESILPNLDDDSKLIAFNPICENDHSNHCRKECNVATLADSSKHSNTNKEYNQNRSDGSPLQQWMRRSFSTSLQRGRNISSESDIKNDDRGESSSSRKLSFSFSLRALQSVTNRFIGERSPIRRRRFNQVSVDLNFFDAACNSDSLKQIVRDAPLPDRHGYILDDELLRDPKTDTPLLVFVNSRSGSQQGLNLKFQLRRLLNPIQVWDLADGGPEKVLLSFSVLTRLRILVCGGDGTVSWIISTLDKLNLKRWPPIAILPIGTGNDLARIHGWGGGYANQSLLLVLNQVQESYVSLLDRWELSIIETSSNKLSHVKSFTNYMSLGSDAQSALQLHKLRENSPDLFFSRAINKVWYALFGAEDAIKASCSGLSQKVTIEADGIDIPIPSDSQGLIFLNIDSYLGGVPLWARGIPVFGKRRRSRSNDNCVIINPSVDVSGSSIGNDDKSHTKAQPYEEALRCITACYLPSSCQDGKLDVISYRGNFHLGQVRLGLGAVQLLCQCSEVTITLKKATAVQIDGEPWKQNKCQITLKRKTDPAIMLHKAAEEGGGTETILAEVLDWAEEKELINSQVHTSLMKEFSRRIESKTRERRNRSSKENLLGFGASSMNMISALSDG